MRLFEIRRLDRTPSDPPDPIVLAVARDRSAAVDRVRAVDLPFRQPSGLTLVAEDLGPHDGPEPGGSVFVDGLLLRDGGYGDRER